MFKKIIFALMLAAVVPLHSAAAAKDSTSVSEKGKYARMFVKDRKCVTARRDGAFMTLHKSKGKLYIELPLEYFGREMLIASTITGCSAADLASVGYKPTDPLHIKFEKKDSTIFLKEVTVLPDYDKDDKPMSRAVSITSMEPVLNTLKMICYNTDSSAVVFEVTSLFASNEEKLAPVKSGSSGGINLTASYNAAGTVLGDIKVFSDNATIKTSFSYKVSADFMKLLLLKKDQPFSVEVTRTILLLPQKKMRPRVADSRVGIFLTDRMDMNPDIDGIKRYSVIKRWDLQPADTAAWLRGELVEPVKPVTYYLDDAFPESWKEPARRGILRWNKAFEKIGLKNAIQVLDFPQDDPDFDPDNLKYSCVRYVPSMISNAMGPSWCDPGTGEIFNASVIVYNDVIKLINSWRFTQTAQVDSRVRGRQLPDDVLSESVEYVIAHEVGHTLGFMHNMSASAAYPVDSLRSASFTREHGTTASIMDYARFNYVAQPGDNASLDPPFLGPYDEWLVKYAYCPVPQAATMKEEAAVLEGWTDEKAGDPLYRYGRQQVVRRYDPSAIEEDLGDDPIKASDYGIANLKYILGHFNEWMADIDPDATLRTQRYEELAKQYDRYIGNVMMNIGGVYMTAVKPGTSGKTAIAVDRDIQSQSVRWVIDQLRTCGWIEDRSLTDLFTMRLQLSTIIQYYTALDLFATSQNVVLSSRIAESDPYTLQDWCDDMYEGVMGSALRSTELTDADRILQSLYVQYLVSTAGKKSNLVKLSGISSFAPSVDDIITYGLDESGLVEQNVELLRSLDEENGRGYVASSVLDGFGNPGYGWQAKVNLRTVDNSKEVFYGELLRIRDLLKKASKRGSAESKTHYKVLLREIEGAGI